MIGSGRIRAVFAIAARFTRREQLVVGVVLGLWSILALRLVQVQCVERDRLRELGHRQRITTEVIPARPGDIVDRHGRLLATTTVTKSLYVVPTRIYERRRFCRTLAPLIGDDAGRLDRLIQSHSDKEFLWIRRRMPGDTAARLGQADLPPQTWGLRDEFKRHYPQGRLAAHVIGLRDIDGAGRGGVEESLDRLLRGRDGQRTMLRDAHGRIIDISPRAFLAPEEGTSVTLTIDLLLQSEIEQELDRLIQQWEPLGACAIVMSPTNGEILAMASRPTFDLNVPTNVPAGAWTNLAISGSYEPGSTFKPLVMGYASDRFFVEPGEMIDCERGRYRMGRRTLHDHHPYGLLSVNDVLVKSSNIGMAKIAERIGNRGLYEACLLFGFGRKSGIELPGEITGKLRPLVDWDDYSTGSIPMGHEIACTPLQLITAHAAIAGDGRVIAPRICRWSNGAESGDGPLVVSRAIDDETAKWLREGALAEVIQRGTGRRAARDDFSLFGKTGTSQKFDPETGDYSHTRHVASFVCAGPVAKPKAIVVVVVDEPTIGSNHGGGTVAAPAASEMLAMTLRRLGVSENDRIANRR